MSLRVQHLEWLASPLGRELLTMPLSDEPLAALTALRKRCGHDEAAAVLAVRQVRQRAREKFPPHLAERLWGTDRMLQQASSLRVAIYKGGAMQALSAGRPVWDLCCGLGADAIGSALAGAQVQGYDQDELAVACAAHNAAAAGAGASCRFERADVTQLTLPHGVTVHIDPDRRAAGRRTRNLNDYSPPGAFLRRLAERTAAGAVKLSPAQDWRELIRNDWPTLKLEWVSEHGVCRQLIAWWGGGLRQSARLATVLSGPLEAPEAHSLPAGLAQPAPLGPPQGWLIEPDPAVIAAGGTDDLAAAYRLERVDPRLDWLFAPCPVQTCLARSYELLRIVPGRQRDIARAVAELGGGLVEVKARGLKLDTDSLQRALRGRGDRPLVVAWCRLGPRQQAFLCRRAPGGVTSTAP